MRRLHNIKRIREKTDTDTTQYSGMVSSICHIQLFELIPEKEMLMKNKE